MDETVFTETLGSPGEPVTSKYEVIQDLSLPVRIHPTMGIRLITLSTVWSGWTPTMRFRSSLGRFSEPTAEIFIASLLTKRSDVERIPSLMATVPVISLNGIPPEVISGRCILSSWETLRMEKILDKEAKRLMEPLSM